MKSRLTLKNIAEEFNVSIATVSKALKDSDDIGYKTRQKIKAYAKQHNYVPNHFALKLKQNKTHTIGVLIPSILNLFFAIDRMQWVSMSQKATAAVQALSKWLNLFASIACLVAMKCKHLHFVLPATCCTI